MKIIQYKTPRARWAIRYNEDKIVTDKCARIGGNLAGDGEIVEGFLNHYAFKRESTNLKNRFVHMKISLSPVDSHITNAVLRAISKAVLNGLGYTNNPHIIYRHYDTAHPHVHIVLSRVTFEGILVRDSFDGLRTKRLERALATDFGLTPSFGRLLSPAGVRLPQKWEVEYTERTGCKTARNYIQCAVFESLFDKPALSTFLERLERRGVRMWRRETIRDTGVFHGLSYTYNPEWLNHSFREMNEIGLAGGITMQQAVRMTGKNITDIEHEFFGSVRAAVRINHRGIPELCLNSSEPFTEQKAISFRAAALGPFFQYQSIAGQLALEENNVLDAITIRQAGLTKPENYSRWWNGPLELGMSKLSLATEFRSIARVTEALQEIDWRWSQSATDQFTLDQIAFVQSILQRQQREHAAIAERVERLTIQFKEISGIQPDKATTAAIALVAGERWAELADALSKATTDRTRAPHPSLMYLDLPDHLSMFMLDYAAWFNEHDVWSSEDPDFLNRRKDEVATIELIQALERQDSRLAHQILDERNPDVSTLSLELVGKILDVEVAQRIKDRMPQNGTNEDDSSGQAKRRIEDLRRLQHEKKLDLDHDETRLEI